MDIYAAITTERLRVADLVERLDAEQLATPSLCAGWSVKDVVGHLVLPLVVSIPRFGLSMLAHGGSFDRANTALSRREAARPQAELASVLRARAGSRFAPPGRGPESPLTDVVVHAYDICRPLGLSWAVDPEVMLTVLQHAAEASQAYAGHHILDGVRLVCDDVPWSHGEGAQVEGRSDALLLAMTGRAAVLDDLHGPGVALLQERIAAPR